MNLPPGGGGDSLRPMQPHIEKSLVLPNVSIQLATVEWAGVEQVGSRYHGYNICQRLSDNHAPLRIGNVKAREAFPRLHSVGFLPPGCAVKLYPVDGPFRVLNCLFDPDHFESVTGIGQKDWDEHTGALVWIRDRRLELLMQEIHAELVQPGYRHEMLVEAAATMILVEMGRYGRRLAETSGQEAPGQGLAPWQMRRINERLGEALAAGYPTMAELAKLCGISQSHLMRTFKATTGWPIHKYIAEERIRAAKAMLADNAITTKEVAARLGFRSPAYFATAFRRATGLTPSDFRRQSVSG